MAGEKRLLQLNELDELHLEAYESSQIYKERTKHWHDKHIVKKRFKVGDSMLLLNFKLWLFPRKLRSRWSGPFKAIKVFPYRVVELWSETTSTFKVKRGICLNHIMWGNLLTRLLSITYLIPLPFSVFCFLDACIEDNALSKHGEVVVLVMCWWLLYVCYGCVKVYIF